VEAGGPFARLRKPVAPDVLMETAEALLAAAR
jgi:hypothetical protein